jgi:hypothetical protein
VIAIIASARNSVRRCRDIRNLGKGWRSDSGVYVCMRFLSRLPARDGGVQACCRPLAATTAWPTRGARVTECASAPSAHGGCALRHAQATKQIDDGALSALHPMRSTRATGSGRLGSSVLSKTSRALRRRA